MNMDRNDTEYSVFLVKLASKAKELRDEWDKLSVENKVRFANEASLFLKQYNIAVTVTDIMRMVNRH